MHVPTDSVMLVSMQYQPYWSNMDFHPVSIVALNPFLISIIC